jgi:hypothetical protein
MDSNKFHDLCSETALSTIIGQGLGSGEDGKVCLLVRGWSGFRLQVVTKLGGKGGYKQGIYSETSQGERDSHEILAGWAISMVKLTQGLMHVTSLWGIRKRHSCHLHTNYRKILGS